MDVYIWRDSNNYSGLSVATLSKALGKRLDLWYDTVYHFHSRMTHGADARHMEDDATTGEFRPACFSTDQEIIGTALETGTSMFLVCNAMLANAIDFGPDAVSAMASFVREREAVFDKKAVASS